MNYYLCLVLLAVGCNGHASFREREAGVERPCPVRDLECVGRFLADHSICHKARGFLADPLHKNELNHYYPWVNITVLLRNAVVTGIHNGHLTDFYINTNEDIAVISIEFPEIRTMSRDAYFTYFIKGYEPIVTHGYGEITVRDVSVTAILHGLNDLRIDLSSVSSYVAGSPSYRVDKSISTSPDHSIAPLVEEMFAALDADESMVVQEFMLSQGPFYYITYLQSFLCDFGIRTIAYELPL